nr:integrase, catalytic region, zinc finger, CCHC-type, peptidase aspartic, catalytic [Tanacetum cinerariifolium]
MNMSPENKAHFQAEKEAIHLILTGIRDEIYSTVDAFQIAQEIETMESYYTRFYKLMNEMIQNNLTVATMQVNVQFLQQLQPEWSRLARNANPLALVASAQGNQDPYYQTSKSHKSYAPSLKPLIPIKTHTTTRYKGKEIAKPITPPSETAFEEDSDPEQAQKDKDTQKNLALIAKYFKKIYKPTNNNLITSLNSRNKNVDTTPWYKNDNQSKQFGNQRTVNVAGAMENVGSSVVQQSGIQYTDEEFDEQELEAHYSYMAKIPEVPAADTCTDSEPLEQVQNDTRFNMFANDLQQSEQSESISNTCLVETDDSNVIPDSPDMCDDDIQNDQNDVESDDERITLANLIANLILDESNSVWDSCLVALQNKQTEFEKYKAFNDRTVDYDKLERKLNETLGQLAQKDIDIKEGLKTKAYEILVVKEKHDELMKQSLLIKSHYEGLVKKKTKFAPILGYGDLVQGNITINRVYYVEGLNQNLFSVGQFCDADLEVAFWKSTCFVRDLQVNDLLTGNRGSDLYTISLQESTSLTLLCLMAKASVGLNLLLILIIFLLLAFRVDAVEKIKEKHQSNVDATRLKLKLFKDDAAVAHVK